MGFYRGSSADFTRRFEGRLRRIARGAEFQYRFRSVGGDACKLFGVRSGYQLSDQQLALWHYGEFYNQIYKMPSTDKPPDYIINNDAELDQWLDRFIRQQNAKARGLNPNMVDPARAIPVFGANNA